MSQLTVTLKSPADLRSLVSYLSRKKKTKKKTSKKVPRWISLAEKREKISLARDTREQKRKTVKFCEEVLASNTPGKTKPEGPKKKRGPRGPYKKSKKIYMAKIERLEKELEITKTNCGKLASRLSIKREDSPPPLERLP